MALGMMEVTTAWLVRAIATGLPSLVVLGSCMSPRTGDADAERRALVEELRTQGVCDERVLAAIARIPRHEFVPATEEHRAYANRALPIGGGQTISQPLVVATMSAALELDGTERVLEVGTGSGYQAAVLSVLAREVYSVEIDADLAVQAKELLARLGIGNVRVRAGDGFYGWPEAAPFDAIIVTAAAPRMPERLVEQLGAGGRIIAPIGDERSQRLVIGHKRAGEWQTEEAMDVLFVPMTGEIRAPID